MRPTSSSGPSRFSSSKPSSSKGKGKPAAAPPPPSSDASDPSDASDASDDDDDDDDGDEDDLPELEDDEEDEFEEDRQRTKGVAVWQDDEGEGDEYTGSEDGEEALSGSENDDVEDDEPRLSASAKGKGRDREMARIQEEMRSLPISAIMKAKRSLARGSSGQSAADEDEDDVERAERVAAAREKLAEMMRKKKPGLAIEETAEAGGDSGWPKRDTEAKRVKVKRVDKHAPSEVTSKKMVSRKRTVVETEKVERRDPRFSSLSGTVDAHLHAKSYGFLSNLVAEEYVAGQEALKAAQKALRNAPRALREEREADVDAAERNLARLRTKKELDERTRREREAIQGWKKTERQKQAEGKGQWHMKNSEKKRLLVEAKHAALMERGGTFAVKKAVEKKRKKDAGKEKKSRPRGLGFGPGSGSFDGAAPARKRVKM